ncbi:MAG: sulfatase-like hydrolase/transferase [Rikenellaceae bacterium]
MDNKNRLLILGSLLTVCSPAFASNGQESKPNIIFILVDDLGKEWIQQYGAENINLTHLQELADKSVIFNRAYSMPQSTPSRLALLTGQFPYNNGWVNHFDVPRWANGAHFDTQQNPSYAIHLQNNGYKTCAAGKWQINDFRLQPDAMNLAGFDEYCMWTGTEVGNVELSDSRYWDPYIHTKEGSKVYKGQFGPDIYSDFITDFIADNKDNPFFVYYAMTLTHTPFVHTPLDMDAETDYEKHKAMVEYTDFIIGKLMDCLEKNGVADDTYIMFTTDNGTGSRVVGMRNGHYIRGGKTLLSENGINCPFIVHVPGQTKQRTSEALIDFTDMYPTFLDLTNSTDNGKYKIDGRSFAGVLKGKDKNTDKGYALSMGCHAAYIGDDGFVKNMYPFKDRAIMGDKYKVYITIDRVIDRVYDIPNDPYEKNNLVEDAKVMKKVEKEFGKLISELPANDSNPKYNRLENDPTWDVALKNSAHVKRTNYRPEATEEDYNNFVNPPAKK